MPDSEHRTTALFHSMNALILNGSTHKARG